MQFKRGNNKIMKIACLDIETMGTESTCVILSAAIGFADITKEKQSIEELRKNTQFVKFSVKDQVENYKRTIDKDTIAWWNKQCDIAKDCSFFPKKTDLTSKDGIAILRKYILEQCIPEKTYCFIRGSLDQLALDSLCRIVGEPPLFPFFVYRDCRTYIECCAENPRRGYCDIDDTKFTDYKRDAIIKHLPQEDIVLDLAMILSC